MWEDSRPTFGQRIVEGVLVAVVVALILRR